MTLAKSTLQQLEAAPMTKEPPRPHTSTEGQLDKVTFGQRLKSARKELGWTLQELSDASGVSVTTISRAERGQLELGYENFSALARALQLDMGALFAHADSINEPLSTPVVTRSGKGVQYKGRSFVYEFLASSVLGKRMIPIAGVVHARQIDEPADFARHSGEEFLYVISGKVEVRFETGEHQLLNPGDSVYFDSRIGHAFRSVGRSLAQVVGVTTGESGQMQHAKQHSIGQTPRTAATQKRRLKNSDS